MTRRHEPHTGVWMIRRGRRFYDAVVAGPRWQLCYLKGTRNARRKVLAYLGREEAHALLRLWGFTDGEIEEHPACSSTG